MTISSTYSVQHNVWDTDPSIIHLPLQSTFVFFTMLKLQQYLYLVPPFHNTIVFGKHGLTGVCHCSAVFNTSTVQERLQTKVAPVKVKEVIETVVGGGVTAWACMAATGAGSLIFMMTELLMVVPKWIWMCRCKCLKTHQPAVHSTGGQWPQVLQKQQGYFQSLKWTVFELPSLCQVYMLKMASIQAWRKQKDCVQYKHWFNFYMIKN